MKKMMNLTNCTEDVQRFKDNADLKAYYSGYGLDGIELLQAADDMPDTIRAEDVVGAHLKYLNYWVCVWNGDEQRVLDEFGTWEECGQFLGGTDRQSIIESYRENLDFIRQYRPAYGVFHVCDISIKASMDWQFEYMDEQVIDAVIELVDEVYDNRRDGFTLLFENLWWPGINMLRPEMVRRLLDGVGYKDCGVMLDIGHLLHTNPALRTPDEGIDYIYRVLDAYGDLGFIKGIHLHQTLNGEHVQQVQQSPMRLEGSYMDRFLGILQHIAKIDSHTPFESRRLNDLIRHIDPEYLVYEFITHDRAQHEDYMRRQLAFMDV